MMSKKHDLLILILLIFLGVMYATLTQSLFIGRATISGAVSLILPVIYLGLRKKKNWPKIFVSTLVFGGIFGFIFEFVMEYNRAYSVVSTLFPFKVFGVMPIDNVLGHMMMTCLTVTFYEHFIDREKHHSISKNLWHAVLPGVAAVAIIIITFFVKPDVLTMRYPYLYGGIAAISAPLYLAYKRPQFIRNMAETAAYFFFFYFIIELFAVNLKYWIYPGNNYIGWVTFMNITFPFEELFFWMLFYAATLVSYYELFVDW